MNTKDIATFEARVEGVSETLTSINNIKEKVSDLKQETLELRNEKARQDAQIKINQDTLAKYSRAMADSNRIISKYANENIELGQKLSDLKTKGEEGTDQWNRLTKAINTNNTKIDSAETKIKELNLQHDKLNDSNKAEIKTRNALNKKIKENTQSVKEQESELKKLNGSLSLTEMSYNQLSKKSAQLRRELNSTTKAANPQQWNQLEKELKDVEQQMDRVRVGTTRTGSALNGTSGIIKNLTKMAKAFILVELVMYLKELFVSAYKTRKEFARYEAILRNTLQSQGKATQAMAMLQKLAAETPFSLSQLTDAYIKMINRGLKPTEKEIIKLGDLASSQGKDMNQLVEAILDAQTGEFERLKEFGIRASKEGDRVKFAFKGVTSEVKFTEKAISSYIYSLGDLQGVHGSMKTQMTELEGVASNLSDTWDGFLNVIGKRIEPAVKSTMKWLGSLIASATSAFTTLEEETIVKQANIATNAADTTKKQVDSMVNKLVTTGLTKQKATEKVVALLRKQIAEDLLKAEEKKTILETKLRRNLWPTAKKTTEKDLLAEKGKILKYKSEIEALDSKLSAVNPKKEVVSDAEQKKRNAALKSQLDTKLQEIENSHQTELSTIKKNKLETTQAESEYIQQTLTQDAQFYTKKIELLNSYLSKTADPKIQANINKQIIDAQSAMLTTQLDSETVALQSLKTLRDKQLNAEQERYTINQTTLDKALAENKITQEQHESVQLSIIADNAQNRLIIQQNYLKDIKSLEQKNGNEKSEAITEANNAVLEADLKAAQARAKQQLSLQNLVKDFKDEFSITTPEEDLKIQLQVLQDAYDARKEMAEKANMDILELDKAFEKAKSNITEEFEDKRYQVRSQYGLVSKREELNTQIETLNEHYANGLLSEEEYQKAKLNLQVKYHKDGFDYFHDLASGAVDALQQAELDNIDATYDAEIAAAQGNADEVARLEQEKEQKKLDVQKKYADIQFGIKASEIIANTAVSIMQAFAQLGPIAGAIAGGLMAVTGAAQLASANAERKKIKNMTVSGGSSSTPKSTQRVVTPGAETGGYIPVTRAQDNKDFDATYNPLQRGYIDRPTVLVGEGPIGQSREWVASNAAILNPTIRPIIDLIDQSQRTGTIRTIDMNQLMRQRMSGLSTGGSFSPQVQSPMQPIPQAQATPNNDLLISVLTRTDHTLTRLITEGLDARVLLSDIEKKQKQLQTAKKIGSK